VVCEGDKRTLKVAVHFEKNIRDDNFAHRWITELERINIEVVRLNFLSPNIIKELKECGCQGAMWHWIHTPNEKISAHKILYSIEKYLGMQVFPNINTSFHYDEKVSQYYIFEALGIPRIPSWVFWDYQEALTFVNNTEYPLVFKLSVGAGSANVLKVDNRKEALGLVKLMFSTGIYPYTFNEYKSGDDNIVGKIKKIAKILLNMNVSTIPYHFLLQKNYVYFQKFIPDNKFDIRITIINGKAFGYIRENRQDDFRASGSGRLIYDKDKIPIQSVEIGFSLINRLSMQSIACDFLLENNNVLINEISYSYVSDLVCNCKGYWDENLKWHNKAYCPEELHIEEFVKRLKEFKD